MTEKTVYVADDGKESDNEKEECKEIDVCAGCLYKKSCAIWRAAIWKS